MTHRPQKIGSEILDLFVVFPLFVFPFVVVVFCLKDGNSSRPPFKCVNHSFIQVLFFGSLVFMTRVSLFQYDSPIVNPSSNILRSLDHGPSGPPSLCLSPVGTVSETYIHPSHTNFSSFFRLLRLVSSCPFSRPSIPVLPRNIQSHS